MNENLILCGIYKITSPSGKIYIGYSKDIYDRWNGYRTGNGCRKQRRLNNSFLKYGYDAHIKEVQELCDFNDLCIRERYWQDHYDVINKYKGLNCVLTRTDEKPQKASQESLEKMSQFQKGRKFSQESIELKRLTNPTNKKVFCYDLEGNYIKSYISCKAAGREVNLDFNLITACARGRSKKGGNFIWKYDFQEKVQRYVRGPSIPVIQIINNIIINRWDNMKQCGKYFGVTKGIIPKWIKKGKNNLFFEPSLDLQNKALNLVSNLI